MMPRKLHLDRRAGLLATVGAAGGSGDELLTTLQLADWLAVSKQWVEIARIGGYGPPFVKNAGKVFYRRDAVVAWLIERAHRRTNEYPTRAPRRSKNADQAPRVGRPRLTRRNPASAA
jgi:hypothetical protein